MNEGFVIYHLHELWWSYIQQLFNKREFLVLLPLVCIVHGEYAIIFCKNRILIADNLVRMTFLLHDLLSYERVGKYLGLVYPIL